MSFEAKRCGVQFSPPSIVLIYEDKETKRVRKRIIPVRNFSKYSGKARQLFWESYTLKTSLLYSLPIWQNCGIIVVQGPVPKP